MRYALAWMACAFAFLSGCGDNCAGLRCDISRAQILVSTALPGATVTATVDGTEIPCHEAGPESPADWFCSLSPPTEAGVLDVVVSDGTRSVTAPLEITLRSTECCGTLLQGSVSVDLDGDAGI